jgi:hypothetical protein
MERGVAILLAHVGRDVLGGLVQEVAVQAPHLRGREHGLVHIVVRPARRAAMEEPQRPVRIAFAVGEPRAEEAIAPCHAVRPVAPCRERFANRKRQALGHALVSVEAQDPVVARDRDGVLLLPAEAEPFAGLEAPAMAPDDLRRAVGAARIDHEDLDREAGAREARTDLACGVVRDDGDGERELFFGGVRHVGKRTYGRASILQGACL